MDNISGVIEAFLFDILSPPPRLQQGVKCPAFLTHSESIETCHSICCKQITIAPSLQTRMSEMLQPIANTPLIENISFRRIILYL